VVAPVRAKLLAQVVVTPVVPVRAKILAQVVVPARATLLVPVLVPVIAREDVMGCVISTAPAVV
jgi:hypothetical protein